ncbi:Transcription factor TFIIIB component B'' [Pseudocercospora fuligena]|uniref:Transcription factor TFIIIB component B n=1 Tax=Pseudocercospora fuligena TaxID=685502 RepID=A0A8H6VG49_9PEZI|nr:Transcription factor TFIIIB component B'' [Pseudocercospora fuligena]
MAPPTLFTSAAPGKKAAPKAPARRRPAPPPSGPPPSAQPESTPATSVAPPSPPAPQPPVAEDAEPVHHELPPAKEPEQPISEPVREPEVEQIPPEPESVKTTTQPLPTPQSSLDVEAARGPIVEKQPTPQPEPIPQSTPEPTQPTVKRSQQAQPEVVSAREGSAVQSLQQDDHVAPIPEPTQTSVDEQTASPNRTLQQQRLEEFRQVSTAHVLEAASAATTGSAKRSAPDVEESPVSRPAKKPKRSSARSNAKVAAAVNGEEVTVQDVTFPEMPDQDAAAAPITATPKSKGGKKQAAESPTATRRSTRTKKDSAKKKSASTIINSDDEMEGVETTAATQEQPQQDVEAEDAGEAEAEAAAPKRKSRAKPKANADSNKPKRSRKTRMPTIAEEAAAIEGQNEAEQAAQEEAGDESDAELHEIDPNTLSMWDLSYDSKHGKMSERGKKMNEIDWDEVAAKRKAEANLIAAGSAEQTAPPGTVASTEAAGGATEGQAEGAAEGEEAAAEASATPAPDADDGGIGFLLNDEGEIVEDASTMQVDRTAAAVAAAADRPVEDVNDLTTQINRTSWINNNRREATDRVPLWKWKSDPWSEEETDRFYDALRMFGTDFLVISKMFPPKTRRMIKSKFTREEKLDPNRVTAALLGKQTVRMDLNHYARETSRDVSVFTKYESLEHAQQVINESMKEKQEAMTTAAEKEAQLEAEKREKEKQKEKDKAKCPRKGKKAKAAGGFGGGGPAEDDD